MAEIVKELLKETLDVCETLNNWKDDNQYEERMLSSKWTYPELDGDVEHLYDICNCEQWKKMQEILDLLLIF